MPDIALEHVPFQFKPSTFFERTAMHEARGTVIARDERAGHDSLSTVPDDRALLRELRCALTAQATPVVEDLGRFRN